MIFLLEKSDIFHCFKYSKKNQEAQAVFLTGSKISSGAYPN